MVLKRRSHNDMSTVKYKVLLSSSTATSKLATKVVVMYTLLTCEVSTHIHIAAYVLVRAVLLQRVLHGHLAQMTGWPAANAVRAWRA